MAISAALPRSGVHSLGRWTRSPIPRSPNDRVAILNEIDRATAPGSKGAIIRREGLYSSHITEWRRLRALGGLEALGRARGPRPAHPLAAENERLRDRVGHLEARLVRAEKVIAVQGNVSALLRELSLEGAEPKDGR